MEPVWAVVTVSRVYAVGPASTAITAAVAARTRPRSTSHGPTASARAEPTPRIPTTQESHGTKPSERPSSTRAIAVLAATTTAIVTAATGWVRRCQSRCAPIATTAAMAGARTIV